MAENPKSRAAKHSLRSDAQPCIASHFDFSCLIRKARACEVYRAVNQNSAPDQSLNTLTNMKGVKMVHTKARSIDR